MRASTDSFVRRVRGHLEALPETERKLANFVLEFPGELAGYAGNELAELAGVSPSTVSRFIRRIGYESYEEARRHVREEKQSGSPLFQSSIAGSKRGAGVLAHTQVSASNLASTLERLADAQVMEIAQAILDAEQVLIFGSRSSHGFAVYLRWQIIQVVPRVMAIPGAGETLGEHLASVGPRDCVIVFGIRRQTRQVSAVLEAACGRPGPVDRHDRAGLALLAALPVHGFSRRGAQSREVDLGDPSRPVPRRTPRSAQCKSPRLFHRVRERLQQ